MKPTFTTQNVLRMKLDDLRGSHMFSSVFIIFSVFSGCSPKKNLTVPEFCRSDVGYLWIIFNIIFEGSRHPNFLNPFELGQSFIGKWFPKRIGTLTPSNPKIFILFIVHFSFIWTCKTEDIMRLRHRNGGTFGITIYRNMTMNGNTYNDLLVNSVIPELKRINGGVLEPLVWQQDKGVGD